MKGDKCVHKTERPLKTVNNLKGPKRAIILKNVLFNDYHNSFLMRFPFIHPFWRPFRKKSSTKKFLLSSLAESHERIL